MLVAVRLDLSCISEVLRLQAHAVSHRDACPDYRMRVMSGGGVPKDICSSRVTNGTYSCGRVAETTPLV